MLLAFGLATGAVRAQEPVPPVLSLQEVFRDGDGDTIPDRDGQQVTTGGRVSSGVIGQEDGWKDFFLQSGSFGLDVVIPDDMPMPALGDSLVVTGRVMFEGGMMLILESAYRVVETPPYVPLPVPLIHPSTEALQAHRGRLVTMRGTIVGRIYENGNAQLLLYPDGGDVITVFVPKVRVGAFDFDTFTPGTRLRVTGILGQYDEEAPYDEGFLLYPRAQEDFDRVGFTTVFYQRALMGGLLLVLVAWVWAVMLRRQVRRKTGSLFESTQALQRELVQRKEVEEALRRSVVRLDQAQRIAGLGSWEWDIHHGLTGCSDELLHLFGYEPGTVDPTLEWFFAHTHPDDIAAFADTLEHARPGTPCEVEYRIIRADGAARTVLASIAVLAEEAGVPVHIFGVSVDVTERQQYEQALVQAKEQAEEARGYAEEARHRAEEMLRLKSAFLNNMSHEIRTPLTGIIGYADVLAEEVAEEHREFVEVILRSGRRLSDTLNSVLDLAQLDGGAVRLDLQPVEVLAEADEALAVLRPLAEEKGLTMQLRGTSAVALADRKALHRVLTNLVGNAIKFTDEGQVSVEVTAREGSVWMRVADTGPGISPSFLPHLFDEFKQESEGYDRRHEGNGLGLAITKRLVELMGGTIGAESTAGAGSVFTVQLPQGGVAPGLPQWGDVPSTLTHGEAGRASDASPPSLRRS